MIKTHYLYELDTTQWGATSLLLHQVTLVSAQCTAARLVGTIPFNSTVTIKVVFDGSFTYSKGIPLTLNDVTGSVGAWRVYVNDSLLQETVYATNQAQDPRIYRSLLADYTGDDEILCVQQSAGDDIIYSYGGNDRIKGGVGNDYINGGDGIDTAVFGSNYANYRISVSRDTVTVTDSRVTGDGTDTLLDIERLEFADKKFAYDMKGNAGLTAKVLGAVFGVSSLSNKEYVGIGLDLLDDGMTFTQLIDLALNVRLGSNYSIASMVNLLHANTGMSAPTASTIEFWAEMNSDGMNKSWIAEIYADSAENVDKINLVGLASTGIEYI